MRASAAVAAFLMNVVVTRTLGPYEAGLFFLAQTCLVILSTLSRFGLDNSLLRFVSVSMDQGKGGAANAVLWKAFFIAMPLASATSLIAYINADWIAESVFSKPEFGNVFRLVALCVIPFSCFQLISFALQGRNQVTVSIAINATITPSLLLLVALFHSFFLTETATALMTVAIGISVANAILAIVLWCHRNPLTIDHFAFDWSTILATAFPLFCVSVIALVVAWTPQLVLAGCRSAEEIALLSNSQKTASLVGFLLISINAVAAPTYAAMYGRQELEALRVFATKVNGVIVVATIPLLLFTFVFASTILSTFGETFKSGAVLLRILVIGQFVNAATGSVGYLLMMSGNERDYRNATLFSAVLGIVLSFVLIPTYGTIGAAIVTAVTLSVTNLLAAMVVYQRFGINVLKPNVRFIFDGLSRSWC